MSVEVIATSTIVDGRDYVTSPDRPGKIGVRYEAPPGYPSSHITVWYGEKTLIKLIADIERKLTLFREAQTALEQARDETIPGFGPLGEES